MRLVLNLLILPATAHAGGPNPADERSHLPIQASIYDKATHCSSKPRPGMLELQRWLEDSAELIDLLLAPDSAGNEQAHRDHVHIGNDEGGDLVLASPYWVRCDGRR